DFGVCHRGPRVRLISLKRLSIFSKRFTKSLTVCVCSGEVEMSRSVVRLKANRFFQLRNSFIITTQVDENITDYYARSGIFGTQFHRTLLYFKSLIETPSLNQRATQLIVY